MVVLVAAVPTPGRAQVTLDWTRDAAPGRGGVGARLGYERVSTFNFEPSRRSSAMAQLRVDYRW